MADPCPGLERALSELLPRVSGIKVEVHGEHLKIRSLRDPLSLANLLEDGIVRLLKR